MKKLVVLMLCLVMMLGTMATVHANDLFPTAVDYTLGETVNSAITETDKKDEYRIVLPKSGELFISSSAAIDKYILKLFDPEETEYWRALPKADANGISSVSSSLYLQAGEYFLTVAQAYQGGFGDYTLNVSFEERREDFPETAAEKHNSLADAHDIKVNTVYHGMITANDIIDYYKVSFGSKARIVLSGSMSSCHVQLLNEAGSDKWHFTSNWNPVTKVNSADKAKTIPAGTYYVTFGHPDGVVLDTFSGEYTFYVTSDDGEVANIEKLGQIKLHEGTIESAVEAPEADAGITVNVDGEEVVFPDQKPILENDRTLVPLRAIFEALGASVEWDDPTQTVTATKGDITISLQIGSTDLFVNGTAKVIDVPAKLLNSRTLVPVRAISEAFGCTVDWDDATQTVIITQ